MKKSIFDNIGLKLISFLFALILWFFVSGKGKSYNEISYTLPIEFKNIPGELIITNDFNDKIEIRISGPTTLLNSVRAEKLKYTIDLSSIAAGESIFSINPENIGISKGLKITKISPSKINLVIEKIIKKSVPVKLNLIGSLPEGYKIVSQTMDPTNIDVVGAQSEVAKIDSILTTEVNLEETVSSIEKEIDLIFNDIFYSEIVGTKNISLKIDIIEEIIEKEYKGIKVTVRGDGTESYIITPTTLNVTLSGAYSKIKNFSDEDIIAYINTENVTDKTVKLPAEFELPEGLTVTGMMPAEFEIIRMKNNKGKKKGKGKK